LESAIAIDGASRSVTEEWLLEDDDDETKSNVVVLLLVGSCCLISPENMYGFVH
jgi:hypothetical protein